MKIFFLLRTVGLLGGLFLAFISPAAAQAPAWQSARVVASAMAGQTGFHSSSVTATATDAAGNVYLAGYFTNTISLGAATLTSAGGLDAFVTKFDPVANQFLWAHRAGGTGVDKATALTVSGTSVYVAGYFASSTADFGGTNLANAGTGNANADVFVAKLTDAGSTASFAWAQRAGGSDDDRAAALVARGSSVYVAGYFTSATAGFGPIIVRNVGSGSADFFVTKLLDAGSTGAFAWTQRAGGIGSDYATALAVSGPNVYVTGGFDETADFGNVRLTAAGLGRTDVVVAKITDAGAVGTFVWAQRAGGTNYDEPAALAVSGTNVYVAGVFVGVADFGSTNLTTGAFRFDVFVAKLADAGSTGNFVWARRAGGTDDDRATALLVIGASVYVAGAYKSSPADFGATTLNSGTTSDDVFVAKILDAGSTASFTWAQQGAGRAGQSAATALARSGTGLYVAGDFSGSSTLFGGIVLNTSAFGFFGFLASLTDLTLAATSAALPREPAALFPNPAQAATTLRRPAGAAALTLTLVDARGRTVRRYPAPAGPTDTALDLNGLPAGLYLLRGAGPALRLAVE